MKKIIYMLFMSFIFVTGVFSASALTCNFEDLEGYGNKIIATISGNKVDINYVYSNGKKEEVVKTSIVDANGPFDKCPLALTIYNKQFQFHKDLDSKIASGHTVKGLLTEGTVSLPNGVIDKDVVNGLRKPAIFLNYAFGKDEKTTVDTGTNSKINGKFIYGSATYRRNGGYIVFSTESSKLVVKGGLNSKKACDNIIELGTDDSSFGGDFLSLQGFMSKNDPNKFLAPNQIESSESCAFYAKYNGSPTGANIYDKVKTVAVYENNVEIKKTCQFYPSKVTTCDQASIITLNIFSNGTVNLNGVDLTKYPSLMGTQFKTPNLKLTDCPKELYLYTLTENNQKFYSVSTKSEGNNNINHFVPDKKCDVVNSEDITDFVGSKTGAVFKENICKLKDPLTTKMKQTGKFLNSVINIDGNNFEIENVPDCKVEPCTGDDCSSQIDYLIEEKSKAVKKYCNNFLSIIGSSNSLTDATKKRIDECYSFDILYSDMLETGLAADYAAGCGIISQDLLSKVNWGLNMLMVVGPLLAILLSLRDLLKAIASDDPDKSFKKHGSAFVKRIVAAIAIILVPAMLSLILNIFLAPEDGYNKDNPFCIDVDYTR